MRTELLSVIKLKNKNSNSLKAISIRRTVPISSYKYCTAEPFKNMIDIGDRIIIFYIDVIDIIGAIDFTSVKLSNEYATSKISVYSNKECHYNIICLKLHDYYTRSKNNRRGLK